MTGDPDKTSYDHRQTLQRFQQKLEKDQFSAEDRQVAGVVVKCMFQNIALSSISMLIAFKGAGNYINASNNTKLKAWASVLKFGVGFITFNSVRNIYGRSVCLKRVEQLPESEQKSIVLSRFYPNSKYAANASGSYGTQQARYLSPNDSNSYSPGLTSNEVEEQVDHKSHISEPSRREIYTPSGRKPSHSRPGSSQQLDEEQIDHRNHINETGKFGFDPDRHTHETTTKGSDHQMRQPQSLQDQEQPKPVRRNKYGDIIDS